MEKYCLTMEDRRLLEHLKGIYTYYAPFLAHVEGLLDKEQKLINEKRIKQGVLLTKG